MKDLEEANHISNSIPRDFISKDQGRGSPKSVKDRKFVEDLIELNPLKNPEIPFAEEEKKESDSLIAPAERATTRYMFDVMDRI